jgi:hypothetical protein
VGLLAVCGIGVLRVVLGGASESAMRLRAVDDALAAQALRQAIYEWHEAYGAALATLKWEPLADVADRALRIDALAGGSTRYRGDAERIYRFAMFRARAAGAMDGAQRVADALARARAAR